MNVSSPNVFVLQRDDLYKWIKIIWDTSADAVTQEAVNKITDMLKPMTKAKKEHIAEIHQKYDSNICPPGGAPLVLRTAKRGANAGRQFYGCSRCPRCRYIRNI